MNLNFIKNLDGTKYPKKQILVVGGVLKNLIQSQ